MMHLSGQILEPSMAARGVALWISSLVASRVSRGQSQAVSKAQQTNAGYGPTSPESSTKQVREPAISKTSQDSPREHPTAPSASTAGLTTGRQAEQRKRKSSTTLEVAAMYVSGRFCAPQGSLFQTQDSQLYSKTWPKEGSLRNGLLYERPTLGLRTGGSGSSFWPTTTVPNGGQGLTTGTDLRTQKKPDGSKAQVTLKTLAEHWDTPDTMPEAPNKGSNRTNTIAGLGNQAQAWPTPDTNMRGQGPSQDNRNSLTLERAGQTWSTPAARDGKGHTVTAAHPDGFNKNLATDAQAWLTPSANEDAAGTLKGNMQTMLSHQVQTMTGQTSTVDTGLRLNPRFVTWLMGWPVDWLELHSFVLQVTE